MDYFEDHFPEETDIEGKFADNPALQRLNTEWAVTSAIRDGLGIGLKGKLAPTYEQALNLGKILSPKLFASPETQIGRSSEREIIREYRQRAEAKTSLEGQKIEPIEVIDEDITQYSFLLRANSGEKDLIVKKLNQLTDIRQLLLPKKYSENQIILRDLFKAERNIPTPPIDEDTYREYKLSEDRGLRIRLLHPEIPEHSLGADLIYEQYWESKKLVRLVFIQYKIWDGKRLLTSQAHNLKSQIGKLKNTLCDNGFCKIPEKGAQARAYRLPFCVAFLRPTDALQDQDSRLISSGLHIPICVVEKAWKATGYGGEKIERNFIRSESLSHKVFEETFNINMIGSRWFNYKQIESLYREHKILTNTERIKLHMQEFSI